MERVRNIHKEWHDMEYINRGSTCEVFKATNNSGEVTAVKVAPYRAQWEKYFIREAALLKNVSHPNVLKVLRACRDKEHICIETEYLEGNELFDEIIKMHKTKNEKICFSDVMHIVHDIFHAIDHLHSNSMVHRDIKPENFVLRKKGLKSDVVLIDFGLAGMVKDDKFYKSTPGTIGYASPEVISKKKLTGEQIKAGDMWSVGVVLFCLLSGKFHVKGRSEGEEIENITNGNILWTNLDGVSDTTLSFIKKLLSVDWEQRYTTKEALFHLSDWDDSASMVMSRNCKSLTVFVKENHVKQFVHTLFQDQNNDRLEKLRSFFDIVDETGEGIISKRTLGMYLKKEGFPKQKILTTVTKIFEELDQDGYILLADLEMQWSNYCMSMDETLTTAVFNEFANEDGTIGCKDIVHLFDEDEEEAQSLMAFFDSKGNGRVNLEDFKAVMKAESSNQDTLHTLFEHMDKRYDDQEYAKECSDKFAR